MASDWAEVGERCWVRRYPEWDVNVGVVAGAHGLLIVDTRATVQQGQALRDDVRRLSTEPVRLVANTHVHFDHTFGNLAFDGAEIWAHENVVTALPAHADRIKQLCHEHPDGDPDNPAITAEILRDVVDTELRPPDRTFSSVAVVDLGDRAVELVYCGRGHTDGDIAVRVADSDLVFAGDLLEESAPPNYGPDSYPLEWPAALEMVLSLTTGDTAVVPGHGTVVDRGFVETQHADIAVVANTIGQLAAAGVPQESALAEGDWPWEAGLLREAVRRGYQHAAPPPDQLRVIS